MSPPGVVSECVSVAEASDDSGAGRLGARGTGGRADRRMVGGEGVEDDVLGGVGLEVELRDASAGVLVLRHTPPSESASQ
eukprot:2117997-Rhodomonas_salina.1